MVNQAVHQPVRRARRCRSRGHTNNLRRHRQTLCKSWVKVGHLWKGMPIAGFGQCRPNRHYIFQAASIFDIRIFPPDPGEFVQ
jgi:hypothetical protein